MKKCFILTVCSFFPLFAAAQLAVTVSPVSIIGQKAIVPVAMKNGFATGIQSARAAVFLLNEDGKMIGQTSKWVIGGTQESAGLAAGASNAFYFVIPIGRALKSTNVSARVSFSRVVLDGGKLADVSKDVRIESK